MTFSGDIHSINRFGLKKDVGMFAKASFEESFHHFLNAAVNEETDHCKGLSASIVCGKKNEITYLQKILYVLRHIILQGFLCKSFKNYQGY